MAATAGSKGQALDLRQRRLAQVVEKELRNGYVFKERTYDHISK
jgi:hypothetical protein